MIAKASNIGVALLVSALALPALAQFDRTHVNIVCPCSLVSTDGMTAEIGFGVVNYTENDIDEIHVTVSIGGDRLTSEGDLQPYTALVDTVPLATTVTADSTVESLTYVIDLGVIPQGTYYYELIIHQDSSVSFDTTFDSIWFKDDHPAPFSALNLQDANYLIDTDGDGVGDINEESEGTDPDDAQSYPPIPVIDVLVLHEEFAFKDHNENPNVFIAHVFAATNDMFERSSSPVYFRPVGIEGASIPFLFANTFEEWLQLVSYYQSLLEKYSADLVVFYRSSQEILPGFILCGRAFDIGGMWNRGFLHPNERTPFTELFLDPRYCPLDVTAHEIGHLMGLGHSYAQQSTGTFTWSRGHALFGEFGTIMSYAQVFSAIGIDVFSNPRADCHGKPCGVPHTQPNHEGSADSVLTLNAIKYQFAQTFSPDETFDFDNDGVGAKDDAFPTDPDETHDTDGDRVGDNQDAFPNDSLEWADSDGDGIGDNTDPDIDNDGVPNLQDPYPFDATSKQQRLIAIRSETEGDRFGYSSTRINDLDGDGIADLATSAPFGSPGKVYLFSLGELVKQSDADHQIPGQKSLADAASHAGTWVLHEHSEVTHTGTVLEYSPHVVGVPELVIVGDGILYLVSLNSASLGEFDNLDGTSDRQLDLAHCDASSGCVSIPLTGMRLHDVASISDLNGDGRRELAVSGHDPGAPHTGVQAYILNRAGINRTRAVDESKAPAVPDIFKLDDSSFVLTAATTTAYPASHMANLGDPISNEPQNLLIGIQDYAAAGQVYNIDVEQLQQIHTLDANNDRRVAMNDLVGINRTYRISNPNDPLFGYVIHPLSDIDGEGTHDFIAWGNYWNNFAISNAGAWLNDFLDGALDGSIELEYGAETTFGVWRFSGLEIARSRSGVNILLPSSENMPSVLAAQAFQTRTLFIAELGDMEHLDDPTTENLDGVIDIQRSGRQTGVYELRMPFGPRGDQAITGIESIGDLDRDEKTDFVFSMHSADRNGTFSTLYAVFSSELDDLDQADGDADHIIGLYNDGADTDGDGTPNNQDDDDDNDGLRDFFDVYPHLSQFQYDADRDGHANAIDAFPLDPWEQLDTDSDGIGDLRDDDIDGDGIPNAEDEYPLDSDNDALPNRVDPDDDNDLVLDEDDAFPLDATESLDTDGDGVGDNRDAFALDPNEWLDTDLDGVGDNSDIDDDGDGYPDVDDAFPLLASEWLDTDGDGVGDNADVFPLDPLEWADKDGDGVGDNLGGASIKSYRFLSDWLLQTETLAVIPEVFRLGDYDRDGVDDIEIAYALPHANVTRRPSILVSGNEFGSLDELDGLNDRIIALEDVHQGSLSMRFIDTKAGQGSLTSTNATIGDLNGDALMDLAFYNSSYPNADYSGSVTLAYGGRWTDLDTADGTLDGEIDLQACLENDLCTRIPSSSSYPPHGIGLNGTLIANLAQADELSLILGTVSSKQRGLPRDEGVPTAYIFPYAAIAAAESTASGAMLDLDTLAKHSQAWSMFPEYDELTQFTNLAFVGRVPDLDGDGTDEILLNYPRMPTSRTYILASGDLTAMDSADSSTDRQIDLAHAYQQTNSFRIDGLEFNPINAQMPTAQESVAHTKRSHMLPFVSPGFNYEAHLIDANKLDEQDRADGSTDGIVSNVTMGEYGAWTFPGIGNLMVCPPDEPEGSIRTIATPHKAYDPLFSQPKVYVFDARDVKALDQLDDGVSNGRIDLDQAIRRGSKHVWELSFGKFAEHATNFLINCSGDFDNDTQEDLAVSMIEQGDDTIRIQVILLSYADLKLLNQLDHQPDSRIDVSMLWADN